MKKEPLIFIKHILERIEQKVGFIEDEIITIKSWCLNAFCQI
jgi:hypothetical protein